MFFTLWFSYAYIHQRSYDQATPFSRLALLHAWYEKKTLAIDAYQKRTSDKAYWQGHYYSDKAPGTAAACLPAFGAAVQVANLLKIELDSKSGWLLSSWVACAFSLAPLTALGGVAFWHWLAGRAGYVSALVATLGLFLGAAPYPYATMMYSHAFVIGLIAVALWTIDRERTSVHHERLSRFWPDELCGFSLGLALASEFTAGLVIIGIGIYWLRRRGWRHTLLGSLAAIPPLLLIPLYSVLCFGTPFTLGYAHQATYEQMQQGLFGIQWPNLRVACKLLFTPNRGLFFWTPFLLMAWLGYRRLYQFWKPGFWLALLAPVVQLIVISGYVWDWPAGWVLGPRYLAPALPLLALPAAIATRRHLFAGAYLAWVSILLTGLATYVDATPPSLPLIDNPLFEIHLPKLFRGEINYTLGTLAGLDAFSSLALLVLLLSLLTYKLYRLARDLDNPSAASSDMV